MSYFENNLLRLRALEPNDVELLYAWENDPDIWHVGDVLTLYSKHTLAQYIESAHKDIYEQKQVRFVVEEKKEGTFVSIGLIDLFDIDFRHQRAGVGILIHHPNKRGKGFATSALRMLVAYSFNVLALHQLYCNIAADNADSIKLFEGAGFKQAGVKKDWRRTQDGWQDELLYQLINPHKLVS